MRTRSIPCTPRRTLPSGIRSICWMTPRVPIC
jgi:hypothetical protein